MYEACPMRNGSPDAARAVRRWLWLLWALVLAMVLLGGITRLTGSGLSITEWAPLMGAIPPTSDAEWQQVFARYRASPQFQLVNHWMQLDDFKRIFFWEYVHRLVGRLIGLVFLGPWLWFLARRMLPPALVRKTLLALVLGGSQGLLGWLMVKSGLVNAPRVSHVLLAAHLSLAFGTGQWLLWLALDLGAPATARPPAPRTQRSAAWAFVALVAVQCVYGAFMAGTQAGLLYATFPDMNGRFAPGPFFYDSVWRELWAGPMAIHWMHRTLAWLVLFCAFALAAWMRQVHGRGPVGRAAVALGVLAFVQLNLGALTVVMRVATPIAVAHQAMAYLLLSVAIMLCHRLRGVPSVAS